MWKYSVFLHQPTRFPFSVSRFVAANYYEKKSYTSGLDLCMRKWGFSFSCREQGNSLIDVRSEFYGSFLRVLMDLDRFPFYLIVSKAAEVELINSFTTYICLKLKTALWSQDYINKSKQGSFPSQLNSTQRASWSKFIHKKREKSCWWLTRKRFPFVCCDSFRVNGWTSRKYVLAEANPFARTFGSNPKGES